MATYYRTKGNRLAIGVVACAMTALAGSAWAQMEGFDRPLGEAQAQQRDAGPRPANMFMSLSKIEGDQRYDLEIRDGDVTAKVNGVEVPPDRVRHDGERYEILGDDGEVLASFNVAQPRLGLQAPGWREFQPGRRGAPQRPQQAPPMEMPRVMIGIVMAEVPEPLLAHLELEPGSAVMIDRVVEGLPAERAGLRARDIIVAVEGQRGVTPETIRDAINRKNAGESVEVRIIRRGQEQTIAVELEAFDAERMGMPAPADEFCEDGHRIPGVPQDVERMLREQMEAFRMPLEDGQWERLQRQPRGFNMPEGFEFFVPMTPRDRQGSREQLTQLDERMADLERQMERLAQRMEELRRSLDRGADDQRQD